MAHYGFFCTQYMLHHNCLKGDTCLFFHIKRVHVILDEPIPNGSAFVKGFFLDSSGHPLKTNPHARSCYSRLPCYYTLNAIPCPYEAACLYTHSSKYWGQQEFNIMDSLGEVPSTSKVNKHSASTSNTATDSEDESCLGATALIRPPQTPRYNLQRHSHDFKKLEKQNQRNLAKLNINAPEFIPKTRFNSTSNSKKRLCPYAEREGVCKYPPGECTYLHGTMCDLCARPALHPFNEDLRKKHTQECIRRHERDMEMSFAIARSKEKVCGICFEVILQKSTEEQRFGILPSCNHCFCLACIRRWRQSKQFENKIIRSCPECRIPSDFVCPSAYWVDTKEDKERVIEKYKNALAKKDCKYFKHGRGHCPFGNKCFYRHCLQNGKKVDVGPPPSTNNQNNSDNFIDLPAGVEIIQRLLMLEHLQEGCPYDDLPDEMDIEDILQMFDISDVLLSDTDESYWSD